MSDPKDRTPKYPAPTARFIEIRARISAGGISGGNEARRLAIRATRFIPDDALAEALANRLADELDYVALIAAMNDEAPGPSDGALRVLDEIEAASRPH